jgi:hypothetical protein
MAKSRNRKDQKKKSRNRTIKVKNQQLKAEKELREIFQKAQEKYLQQKVEQNKDEVVEGVDIGIETELDIPEVDIQEFEL